MYKTLEIVCQYIFYIDLITHCLSYQGQAPGQGYGQTPAYNTPQQAPGGYGQAPPPAQYSGSAPGGYGASAPSAPGQPPARPQQQPYGQPQGYGGYQQGGQTGQSAQTGTAATGYKIKVGNPYFALHIIDSHIPKTFEFYSTHTNCSCLEIKTSFIFFTAPFKHDLRNYSSEWIECSSLHQTVWL